MCDIDSQMAPLARMDQVVKISALWFAFAQMGRSQHNPALGESGWPAIDFDAPPRPSAKAMQPTLTGTFAAITGTRAHGWNNFRFPVLRIAFGIEAH
jgi:hypothetical protein